jgi:hypothetical protein
MLLSDDMLSDAMLWSDDIAPPFELDMLSAAKAVPPAIMSVAAVAASKLRKFMKVSHLKTLPAGCRIVRIVRPLPAPGYISPLHRDHGIARVLTHL